MSLSTLCHYDHLSSTSFCPLVATTIDHAVVTIVNAVKVLYGDVQTPFATESHWWKVNDAKTITTVHHRRDLPSNAASWDSSKTPYPSVKRVDTSFEYQSKAHGNVTVPDPYNWLEASPSDSKDVKAFVDAQNALAKEYFDQCPSAAANTQTIQQISDQPYYSSPSGHGPKHNQMYTYWYSASSNATQSYYIITPEELLVAEKDNWPAPPGKKFFDPSAPRNGTSLSGDFSWSPDGLLTTYAVSAANTSTLTIFFRSSTSPWVNAPASNAPDDDKDGGPHHLPDVLKNVTFFYGVWSPDSLGVFYHASISDKGDEPMLMYHRLGTSQKQDVRVLALDAHPLDDSCAEVKIDESKWLVLQCSIDSAVNPKSRSYAALLDQPITGEMKWVPIVSEYQHSTLFVTYVDDDFYFLTNMDAPFWKMARTHVDPAKAKPVKRLSDLKGESSFVDLIPEKKGYVIGSVQYVNNDKLLVKYLHDVYQQLFQFELRTGRMVTQLFPERLGAFLTINARTTTNEVFATLTNLTAPNVIKRLSWQDGDNSPLELPTITDDRIHEVVGVDLNVLETKEVFVKSTDGVMLPTLLMYRKGTPIDGSAPAWILVIGGFRYTWNPCFDPSITWWVETFGGVFVVASVRGGLEYGEEWHLDGALKKKRNTFIDVTAIAQYLVDEKIAAKGKISLIGAGMGGLVSLAVANMAPEGLFGAMFPVGPLGDMLRYELFGAGSSWVGEFGDPRDPELFDVLYGYSPLHNVNASKTYPLMMLTTSLEDGSIPPLHSFKVIAELQSKLSKNPAPLLMSTDGAAYDDGLRYCLIERALGLKRLA